MNIPPFMSILTHASGVIDLRSESAGQEQADFMLLQWSRHADIKSGLSQRQPFVSLSSHCRLICSVQSRQLSLFCTFPNHTPLGFITPSVWPSTQPQGILLRFSFACSPCSVCAEGLDRLGAVWPGDSVRWGKLQNGTQEEIRNMRSPLCMHEGTQRD